MLSYRAVEIDERSLGKYVELFRTCFPHAANIGSEYMRWLYADNPCGRVVGMDAWFDEVLAAHYVCVPTRVSVFGREVNALLSLNTVTHPDFRGKGLFTKLAESTYQVAAERGFAMVYGVANANSTPGFIRKLGFQLVDQLEARLGIGRQLEIDWGRVLEAAQFRRLWNANELMWRVRSPANPVSLVSVDAGFTDLYAKTDRKSIVAWGELPLAIHNVESKAPNILAPRLFLGLSPRMGTRRRVSLNIPNRLRPSPLNFIIRMLKNRDVIDKDFVSFSFVDFDAY